MVMAHLRRRQGSFLSVIGFRRSLFQGSCGRRSCRVGRCHNGGLSEFFIGGVGP
jgi:hypothetical protein